MLERGGDGFGDFHCCVAAAEIIGLDFAFHEHLGVRLCLLQRLFAVFLAEAELLASGPEPAMAVPATAATSARTATASAGLARLIRVIAIPSPCGEEPLGSDRPSVVSPPIFPCGQSSGLGETCN